MERAKWKWSNRNMIIPNSPEKEKESTTNRKPQRQVKVIF